MLLPPTFPVRLRTPRSGCRGWRASRVESREGFFGAVGRARHASTAPGTSGSHPNVSRSRLRSTHEQEVQRTWTLHPDGDDSLDVGRTAWASHQADIAELCRAGRREAPKLGRSLVERRHKA